MQIEIINQNGEKQKVEGKGVRFSVVGENWNEYELEDGRVLRIKSVLTQVMVPADTSIVNQDGTAIVCAQTTQIVVCHGEVK